MDRLVDGEAQDPASYGRRHRWGSGPVALVATGAEGPVGVDDRSGTAHCSGRW